MATTLKNSNRLLGTNLGDGEQEEHSTNMTAHGWGSGRQVQGPWLETYDSRLYLDVDTTLLAKLNFTLSTHTHTQRQRSNTHGGFRDQQLTTKQQHKGVGGPKGAT